MGTPSVAVPADRIATSTRPREHRSVRPKSPPVASAGLGSGHSIPIGVCPSIRFCAT